MLYEVITDERLISLREKLSDLKKPDTPASTTPTATPPEQADAAAQLQTARAQERAAQIQALELELLSLPGERELMQLQLTQLKRQIDSLNSLLTQLQDRLQTVITSYSIHYTKLYESPRGIPVPAGATVRHPTWNRKRIV